MNYTENNTSSSGTVPVYDEMSESQLVNRIHELERQVWTLSGFLRDAIDLAEGTYGYDRDEVQKWKNALQN